MSETRDPQKFSLWLAEVAKCLRVFWLQIAIAAFASAVLLVPDQTRELYRSLPENIWISVGKPEYWKHGPFWWSVLAPTTAFLALLLLAGSLAYSGRIVEIVWRRQNPVRSRGWQLVYQWMPIAIGAAPIAFAGIGLWSVSGINTAIDPGNLINQVEAIDHRYAEYLQVLVDRIKMSGENLQAAAIALGVMFILFFVAAGILCTREISGVAFYNYSRRPASIAVTLLVVGALIAIFVCWPVAPARFLGTIAVFALFVSCLSIFAGQLVVWSHEYRIPIIPILALWVFLLSLFGWNDNHELRRIDAKGGPAYRNQSAAKIVDAVPKLDADLFRKWYTARPDRADARYANGKYPVYVVAAQGGGIYAAAQTLLFLVRMQIACEAFSQHLFAISSVSGGSVGAALFSALSEGFRKDKVDCPAVELRGNATPPGLSNAYGAAFTTSADDYLAPLVAAMMFPDFAQRFLPVGIGAWSRERGLENAIEVSFARAAKTFNLPLPNMMQQGVLKSWDAAGVRPALIFNTTETGSGRRRLIAPFQFKAAREAKLERDMRFFPLLPDYDVALSTAAVASARFPWLTPEGWFWNADKSGPDVFRLVDGGYFENSGVATAADLIQHLADNVGDLPVEFHLIAITSGGFSEETFSAFDELFAPVRSLLNTRRARTYTTVDQAYRQLGSSVFKSTTTPDRSIGVPRLQRVSISDFLTPLPLGWVLSRSSLSQIDRRVGLMTHCDPDDNFEQKSDIAAFSTADCIKVLTYLQLRGDSLPEQLDAARARYSRWTKKPPDSTSAVPTRP